MKNCQCKYISFTLEYPFNEGYYYYNIAGPKPRNTRSGEEAEVQAKAAEAKAKKDAELGAGAKKKSAGGLQQAPLPESLARKFPGKTAIHIGNMIAQASRMDPGDELELPELTDYEKHWLRTH